MVLPLIGAALGVVFVVDWIVTAVTGETTIDHLGNVMGFETQSDIIAREGEESTALIVEAFEQVAAAINELHSYLEGAFDELIYWMEHISEQLLYIQIMVAAVIILVVLVGIALYLSHRKTQRMVRSLHHGRR